MINIILLTIIITLTSSSPTPKAQIIKKGEKAKINGYILSVSALTKLLSTTETIKQKCEIEKKDIKTYYELELERQKKILKLTRNIKNDTQKQIIKERITPKTNKPISLFNRTFYWGLGIGIVSGIVLTSLSLYGAKKIIK